eukprot:3277543-Pyramimonas_sp.AAC.1
MREAKVEPSSISYSPGISACKKGEQWQRALSLLLRDLGSEVGAICQQRQLWDQRVRERRAVAAGSFAAQRDVGGEGGA